MEANWTVFNIIKKLDEYDRLLRIEDVCEIFPLGKSTVYRLSESGQMPSAMLGGARVFDPSTLAIWIAGKEPRIAKAHRWFRQLEKEEQDPTDKCS
jgi:excisionase family DNA binding protein